MDIFHSNALQNLPKFVFFRLKIYHLATPTLLCRFAVFDSKKPQFNFHSIFVILFWYLLFYNTFVTDLDSNQCP
jgi:hypothetical protein